MRTFIFCVCALLMACGSKRSKDVPTGSPEAPAVAARMVRVLVVPLQDRNDFDQTEYVSMGLAVFATARLEELSRTLDPAGGLKLEAVIGPHVYPREAAMLREDRNDPFGTAGAWAEAQRAGATHVLTGWYSGHVEDWSLTVEVYEVHPDTLVLVGSSSSQGKIFLWKDDVPKPDRPGVQSGIIHAMFGDATAKAFAAGRIVLPDTAVESLSTPQMPDIVAFIRLSEAYRALLLGPAPDGAGRGEGDVAKDEALARAEDAVRIWPYDRTSRSLYAWLLWQHGRITQARGQFEQAIMRGPNDDHGRDPSDIRALTALGQIEIIDEQYAAARDRLDQAAALAPDDPVIRFWLGEAHLRLGETADAIAQYEKSRTLDPSNTDTHRALAGLYAGERRYAEAAQEFGVVVADEPQNIEAVLLMAACMRADGDRASALGVYESAIKRFSASEQVPLYKFRGDMLAALGRADEAEASYREAARLAPHDRRLSGEDVSYGDDLIRLINDATTDDTEMEETRAACSLATSYAVWQLKWNGGTACKERIEPTFALAQESCETFRTMGISLQRNAEALRTSLKNNEDLALTPDEKTAAEEVIRYEATALRDYRELRTGYDDTLKPLLRKEGCETDPSVLTAATIDDVRAWDKDLRVTMPEPKARGDSGISPVVPSGAFREVKFFVKNLTNQEIVMVLDGKALEPPVPPWHEGDELPRYWASINDHVLCHVRKGDEPACVPPNVREGSIKDGDIYLLQ